MMTLRRSFIQLGLALGFGVIVACSGGTSSIESASSSGNPGSSGGEPTPQAEVVVSPPSTALQVTATIIAVTLGDDCGEAKQGGSFAGDCAPDSKGGCGFTCRASNVQLSFKTGAGTAAKVEITGVTLHDAKTGAKVDTLEASNPQSWNDTDSAYVAWDQSLAASSTVKASYTLSSPSWSTIESPDGKSSYSTSYRLRVALKIDGVSVILESTDLNREPAVAT